MLYKAKVKIVYSFMVEASSENEAVWKASNCDYRENDDVLPTLDINAKEILEDSEKEGPILEPDFLKYG